MSKHNYSFGTREQPEKSIYHKTVNLQYDIHKYFTGYTPVGSWWKGTRD